ncbi:MAG: hypothetical protein HPY59_16350 [Anaerolineae bacterium]|nr:hypothetical protein [Anaerolineae bacterium]
MEYGKRIYTQYGWMPVMEEKPMTELEKILFLISDALALPDPHPALIYAARYALTEYERAMIPDWVATLAGGNSDLWEDVVDETRRSIEAEEVES